jgi:hypothetical membrane protein
MRSERVTNVLVGCGLIGAASFVVAFLAEGATRPGYSAWRNFVSQLATGDDGWMQTVNFLVCATLMIAFSVGLWRTLGVRGSGRLGAVLVGLFGVALLVAGTFVTDPGLGYPPAATAPVLQTSHGVIHGLAGLACFTLLPAALVTLGFSFRHVTEWRGWTRPLITSGGLVFVFFVASTVASVLDERGVVPNAPTGALQRIAIITGWSALAAVSYHLLRQRRLPLSARSRRPRAAGSHASGSCSAGDFGSGRLDAGSNPQLPD